MRTATIDKQTETTATQTETPAYPHRAKLVSILNEHSALSSGISYFEGQIVRDEMALDHALDSDGKDEDVQRLQGQLSVIGAKLNSKRGALRKLVEFMPSAVFAAANEYSSLLLDERNRRVGIISKRVAEALGADADRLIDGRYLDDLLDESRLIREVDELRFNFSLIDASPENLIAVVNQLLSHFDKVFRAGEVKL